MPSEPADTADGFCAGMFPAEPGVGLNYRLFEPPAPRASVRQPLLLFLHGAGERGDDNRAQLRHGGEVLARIAQEEPGAFVMAPQCPMGKQWVDTPWPDGPYQLDRVQESGPLAATISLLRRLIDDRRDRIDPNRIYIMGISMGGYGTWDAILRHGELFAAAVPICGSGDYRHVSRLRTLPIWAFHGAADTKVPPRATRAMIAALRADNQLPRYTEYPDAGHDCWSRAWTEHALWEWLFEKRRH